MKQVSDDLPVLLELLERCDALWQWAAGINQTLKLAGGPMNEPSVECFIMILCTLVLSFLYEMAKYT